MNLTGCLATIGDSKPLVHTVADTQSRQLELDFTNNIVSADILIVDLESNVVANILNINVESLVPDGGLSCTVLCLGFELLLACRNLDVRVHLAEGFRIACQSSLDHGQGESSRCCHRKYF